MPLQQPIEGEEGAISRDTSPCVACFIRRGAGERWFCDEAEAIGAGWLAARFR